MTDQKLAALGLTSDEVTTFIANPDNASAAFDVIRAELTARGLGDYLSLDL